MTLITPGPSTAVARLTKGLSCCGPVLGEGSQQIAVTYVSLEVSPQIEETETAAKTLANGAICIPSRTNRFINSVDITMEICPLCVEAVELMSGVPSMLDYAGRAVGSRWSNRSLNLAGWGLETWLAEDSGTDCDPTGLGRFLYMVWPCLSGATLGEFTLDNENSFSATLTASTRPGQAWCRGPYDVQEQFEGDTDGGPLISPLEAGDHGAWLVTSVPPPEPFCEPREVPLVDLGCPSPGETP